MTVLASRLLYNWDNADRLQSLTQGAAAVLFGYDDANRRTSVTYPNGVVATSAYNARGSRFIPSTLLRSRARTVLTLAGRSPIVGAP